MTRQSQTPNRTYLTDGLEIPRIVTGLWQVADMERDGDALDLDVAADALATYADAGFDAFDMADHYGSAELIAGRFLQRAGPAKSQVFTKWVPEPGPMSANVVRSGDQERLDRLGVDQIDLLQFHWWQYEHPVYLDAMIELDRMRQQGIIKHLGLTNFDTHHLQVLVQHGIPIVSNQVSFSLLDRRAAGDMSSFCTANGIRLLVYGTLAGGLLSKRWLGQPNPSSGDITDWSKMKYGRFVEAAGGWSVLQDILTALDVIAGKHDVSISNVASRWSLEHPAVAAVIVGARLGENDHRHDNLALFDFALDDEDRERIEAASANLQPIPGDCGDEYRRPPFLTASGDLTDHLESFPKFYAAKPVSSRTDQKRIDSGSIWETICGFSRAVRDGNRILVSGTTATHTDGSDVCPDDAAGQAIYILDKISASISSLGGRMSDVVRTRVYVTNEHDWEAVSKVHGSYFRDVRPANTLVVVAGLIGGYLVEIEADAIVDEG